MKKGRYLSVGTVAITINKFSSRLGRAPGSYTGRQPGSNFLCEISASAGENSLETGKAQRRRGYAEKKVPLGHHFQTCQRKDAVKAQRTAVDVRAVCNDRGREHLTPRSGPATHAPPTVDHPNALTSGGRLTTFKQKDRIAERRDCRDTSTAKAPVDHVLLVVARQRRKRSYALVDEV